MFWWPHIPLVDHPPFVFSFFPQIAFTKFKAERNESEKKSWMLQTLAKEWWTPLPLAEEDSENIYKEPDLQKMVCILKNEGDPHSKFPKMLAMLPFTEFPEGQPRYSLPNEDNIPSVVHYIYSLRGSLQDSLKGSYDILCPTKTTFPA